MTHIEEHPYFWANLLSIVWLTVLGAWWLDRSSFRLTVIAGLLNAPCFFLVVLLEGTYWTPKRLMPWPVDICDVLCAYAAAAMAWFSLTLARRRRLAADFAWRPFLVRYNVVAAASVGFFLIAVAAGCEGMAALLITCALVSIALVAWMRPMAGLALEGAARFTVLYLAVVKFYFILWPDFTKQWNPSPPLGTLIAGIPLGEILWAPIFGAYWTLLMVLVFRMRISR